MLLLLLLSTFVESDLACIIVTVATAVDVVVVENDLVCIVVVVVVVVVVVANIVANLVLASCSSSFL